MRAFRVLVAVVALVIAFVPADSSARLGGAADAVQTCPAAPPGQTASSSELPAGLGVVEQIGAGASALAVRPPYAYLGVGMRVSIIDVADPAQPTLVSQTELLPSKVGALQADGTTLYAATPAGVYLFDVRDTSAPSLVAFVDSPSDTTPHLPRIVDDVMYLPEGNGFRIIDIAEPSRPVDIGFFDRVGLLGSTAAVGRTMYTLSGLGFSILDVTDPRQPLLVGTNGEVTGGSVVVYGQTAYVSVTSSRQSRSVDMIDVSDPTAPRLLGSVEGLNGTVEAVAGGYLFTGDSAIVDLANPRVPSIAGRFQSTGALQAVVDDHAYFLTNGFTVVDVRDPRNPRDVGSYRVADGWLPTDMAISGSFLYVADSTENASNPEGGSSVGGIRVLDLADPRHPIQIRSVLSERGRALRIKLDGSVGYAAFESFRGSFRGPSGVSVLDLSDPSQPREVAFLRDVLVGNAVGLQARGRHLFADSEVFDVSDPSSPRPVGTFPRLAPGESIVGAATDGSSFYLAVNAPGVGAVQQQSLQVFDVRDPANPNRIANVPISPFSMLELDGQHLYLFDERPGDGSQSHLQVWDVSDPAHPSEVTEIPVGRHPMRFQVIDGFGFASDYGGLTVFDLHDPASPREVAFSAAPPPGGLATAEVYGQWVYMVQGANGLMVTQLNPGDACAPAAPPIG